MAPRAMTGSQGAWARAAAAVLLAGIAVYRIALSPLLGPRCRHVPTCSAYAAEAIRRHGALRGGWLAIARLGRCRPWGTAGYDPVPELPPRRRRRPISEL
jgi:uncharacterized protein